MPAEQSCDVVLGLQRIYYNVPHGRAADTGEPRTFAKTTPQHYSPTNAFPTTPVRRVKGSSGTAYALSSLKRP